MKRTSCTHSTRNLKKYKERRNRTRKHEANHRIEFANNCVSERQLSNEKVGERVEMNIVQVGAPRRTPRIGKKRSVLTSAFA